MARSEEPSKISKLTGADYLNKPIQELVKHPDFSQHAYRVIMAITKMTSSQIEEITLLRKVQP